MHRPDGVGGALVVTARHVVVFTFVAAFVVFCGVQDWMTTSATRRYAALSRTALQSQQRGPTVDEFMPPEVRRSIVLGLQWSGFVVAAGLGVAAAVRQRNAQAVLPRHRGRARRA